jgi:hypothetical protein
MTLLDKMKTGGELTNAEFCALLYDLTLGLAQMSSLSYNKGFEELANTLNTTAISVLDFIEPIVVVNEKQEVLDEYNTLSEQDKVDVNEILDIINDNMKKFKDIE